MRSLRKAGVSHARAESLEKEHMVRYLMRARTEFDGVLDLTVPCSLVTIRSHGRARYTLWQTLARLNLRRCFLACAVHLARDSRKQACTRLERACLVPCLIPTSASLRVCFHGCQSHRPYALSRNLVFMTGNVAHSPCFADALLKHVAFVSQHCLRVQRTASY